MRVRLQSWQKGPIWPQKYFFHNIFKWVSKNTEFDAYFKSVGKSEKSSTKKVISIKVYK
jgi:hypothetical protein